MLAREAKLKLLTGMKLLEIIKSGMQIELWVSSAQTVPTKGVISLEYWRNKEMKCQIL